MSVTAAGIKFNVGGAVVSLLDVFLPVGSLYMTYLNVNPGNFLGGSWSLYSSDRYLRGGNAATAAGSIGGSNTIAESQMPPHIHKVVNVLGAGYNGAGGTGDRLFYQNVQSGRNVSDFLSIGSTGGGQRFTRATQRCSFGGARRRGDSLCCLASRGMAATARFLSEAYTSTSRTFLQALCGPEPSGLASLLGLFSFRAEETRLGITPSGKRAALRASRFPSVKFPTTNTPFLTATIREAAQNSASTSSTEPMCFGLIRSLATLAVGNLTRTGLRIFRSTCGGASHEVVRWGERLCALSEYGKRRAVISL